MPTYTSSSPKRNYQADLILLFIVLGSLIILWIFTGCSYGLFLDLQFPIISLSIIFIKNSISLKKINVIIQ